MDTVRINSDIFREFSIRGIADRDLTDEVVIRIGQAIGAFFGARDDETLAVGRDVRRSSDRIGRSLIRGLVQSGLHVIDMGPVPTPVHNFATDFFGASGGVMVTASHNPPEYNGFKIRAGKTLTGQTLQDLYHRAVAETFTQKHGTLQENDAIAPYLSALRRRVIPGRPLKLVVDGGNGANGPLVTTFLSKQGHQVVELFTEPDGAFPNRNPDPTAEHALSAATQLVVEQQADCGLAYDGDGDRVVLIDDQGAIHFGDIILMLLARQLAQTGPFKVVHDVSCTRALADDVLAHGGEPHAAPVGYAFVHSKMLDIGATLGGETAGHIFCLDDDFRFDDAILASVKLINYIARQSRPVSELIADLPRYHTSPNYRLACPDEFKAEVIHRIGRRYQATHPVDTVDGVKITFEDGWALIRPSNTQPALTFRVEGQTAAAMERLKTELEPVISSELARLDISG